MTTMARLATTLNQLLALPGEKARLLKYWFAVFSFLVIVPNIGFIIEIMFNQPILTIPERFVEIFSLYGNSLRFLLEPVTFSIVMLSVVLALNFLVIRFVRRHDERTKGRLGGTVSMLISSHCVACGGSLLAPVVSLIGGTGTYFSSERYVRLQLVTIILNLVAMAIALRSMSRAGKTINMILSQPVRVDSTPRGY
jgi:hypothetical protein